MYNEKFEEFINDIAYQTCVMYGVTDSSSMLDFRDVLESNVIEEILSCKDEIKVTQTSRRRNHGEVSDFVKSAIIESGLDKKGRIPPRAFYRVKPLKNDKELSKFAVKRYKAIEDDLYGEDYELTAMGVARYCLQSDRPDIEETLKFAFYINDRTNMLIYDGAAFFIKEILKNHWEFEKTLLDAQGYKDTLFYKICDDVINSNNRFDINTRSALIAIAMADYRLNTGIEVTSREIDNINKKVAIARVTNPDIDKYNEEFRRTLSKDTTVIRYIKKK